MINNIPINLRVHDNWIVWKKEVTPQGRVIKVPYSAVTGKRCDITNYREHSNFDGALFALNTGVYDGLGFVLTKDDPFTLIDLDYPKDCDEETKNKIWFEQECIFNQFKSYAERSPSGKGIHIICEGFTPKARKTKIAELYSFDRFMTVTGNVFRNAPVVNENDTLNSLFAYLGGSEADCNEVYAGTVEETSTDDEIINQASNAMNGQKFMALFNGEWQQFYSSQSEADMALLDIIAFYTHNKEQVTRIFHKSGLANRDKAFSENYLSHNLSKVFDRVLPPPNMEAIQKNFDAQKRLAEQTPEPDLEQNLIKNSSLTVPPGLLGEIAQFIYNAAPRPVPEMALVGAIGLMAGICGRAYNVSRTGLNQYILFLAQTGTGKEGVSYGINRLMNEIVKTLAVAENFIGPDKIGSEQALSRHMAKGHPSFVSIIGEFGIPMAQMASPTASPHLMGVKRALLDLYNKSGVGQVARGSIYSDSDKNVKACLSPAFSLIGESVPEKFYQAIDENVVADGLLPRFTILQYNGPRPPMNERFYDVKPSDNLINKLKTLCSNACNLNSQNKALDITFSEQAYLAFRNFDKLCDSRINATSADVTRQLWNRAHIKAMKLAGLIAVGNNPFNPQIDDNAAQWAISLVSYDIENMLNKFKRGDVGGNNQEIEQLKELGKFACEYITKNFSEFSKYGLSDKKLHDNKVLPWSVIQKRLHKIAVFKNDRVSGTVALKRTVQTLIDRGDLVRLSPQDAFKDYNTRCECYVIANPNIGKID